MDYLQIFCHSHTVVILSCLLAFYSSVQHLETHFELFAKTWALGCFVHNSEHGFFSWKVGGSGNDIVAAWPSDSRSKSQGGQEDILTVELGLASHLLSLSHSFLFLVVWQLDWPPVVLACSIHFLQEIILRRHIKKLIKSIHCQGPASTDLYVPG